MIISHKHKFIYFKSRKTAGTTIEVFLSAYCGEKDIITRIGEDGSNGYKWHVPRNNNNFYNHDTVSSVYEKIKNKTIFKDYFKFTSVRNPWDKMVSMYHWLYKADNKRNFESWLMSCDWNKNTLTQFYKLNNKIIVDEFIKYENLKEDIINICDIIGISFNEKYLLHLKRKAKKDRNYKDYYTEKTKKKVEEKFKSEIIDLNYNY